MRILWVTSFNQTLYDLSGRKLVESFLKTNSTGQMLVCHEKMKYIAPDARIKTYEISTYPFLMEWLKRNADIIPHIYGGNAVYSKVIFRNYWNVKASLWFRKIASLHLALTLYAKEFDAIIWIDSDCVITNTLTEELVVQAFGPAHTFYHLGKDRLDDSIGSIESGLIGFRAPWKILHRVFEMYTSGRFRQEVRWDDGYIFRMVIKKSPGGTRDLVNLRTESRMKLEYRNAKDKDVIHRGPFRDYIIHNKGQHKSQSRQYCPPKPTKTIQSIKDVKKNMGKLAGLV